jgi:M6 family metalloprotease-like protein
MLFVEFGDAPAAVSADALVDAYVPRVVEWYHEASYGRLRLVVEPLRRWLRLPRPLGAYDDAHVDPIDDVLAAADAHFDFGGIDALWLLTPHEPGTRAATVIEHTPRRIDGSDLRAWVWFAAGRPEGARPRVLIHETGHVLGLPDLYDVRRPTRGHHHWDVMASSEGAGMLGWHRWKLGWLDPSQVVCVRGRRLVATVTPLARAGGVKAIVARTGNAAVVIEVRARVGQDATLCRGGVLVYRVDFRRGRPSTRGALGTPIDVWRARRGDSARCGDAWRAPFRLGRGEIRATTAFGLRLRLVARLRDGAYRIRVTRT